MRGFAFFLVLLLGVALAMADTPRANRRVALIIENSEYESGGTFGALTNPARDAALVHDALMRAGFDDVRVVPDLNKAGLEALLREFELRAADAEVALIYYAGHGLSASGDNWLAPVDLNITIPTSTLDACHLNGDAAACAQIERELRENAISQTQLLGVVWRARMGIVVLDACRDSPFANLASKPGLAAFEAGGVLLMYSAGSGQEASDGDAGSTSPFARAFAARIAQQ